MANSKVDAEKVVEKRKNKRKLEIKTIYGIVMANNNYWISKEKGSNKIPEELRLLRDKLSTGSVELPEDAFLLLKQGVKKEGVLSLIFELLNLIDKGDETAFYKLSSKLAQEIKEFEFTAALKAKLESLTAAAKTNNPLMQSQIHYELGTLLEKRDASKYYTEAIDHFTLAITIKGANEEVRAYSLRERARLYAKDAEKQANCLADLKEACAIIDQCKASQEDKEIQERGRTYLECGRIFRQKKHYSEALPYFIKAQKLRPNHVETIHLILGTYNDIKPYKNAFECMHDITLDIRSLPAIEQYLNTAKLGSLWLEAANYGSLNLQEYLDFSKVDTQAKDKEGNNGLHIIAKEGYVDLLPIMLRHHSMHSVNKESLTPLFVAAKYGRVNMVLALLQGSSRVINNVDLLSVTVKYQQGCVYEALVQDKSFFEQEEGDLKQQTEATISQQKVKKEISVTRLSRLPYEALLVEIGKQYCGAYSRASAEEQEKLQKEACVGQLFRVAIDVKSISMLTLLIKIHPDGLYRLYQGQSPLHYAVKCGFKEGVYLLVEKSSDLSLQNSDKKVAIELARNLDTQLFTFLENELRRQQDSAKEIHANRVAFIELVIKHFEVELPKGYGGLVTGDNKKRLLDALTTCLQKPEFTSLFHGEDFRSINTLLSLLVNKLVEDAINKKITMYEGMLWSFVFDAEKLTKTILKLIQSPWQAKPTVKPNSDQKKLAETKQLYEFGKISPAQDVFCEHFERQVDAAFAYFTALSNGEVEAIKDVEDRRKADMVKQVGSQLPNIPIPMIGLSLPTGIIISGAMELAMYLRQRFRKQQAERMVRLFQAVTPYERTHFIRYTGEQLANKYRDQIHHLIAGSEGIEQFANCAAARVVEYITSDNNHQIAHEPSIFSSVIRKVKSWALNKEIPPEQSELKGLYAVFLDGIVRVVKSDFPKGKERLKTINHLTLTDNWNSNAIFENTGVIVLQPDGKVLRYAHPNADVNRYGYCYGTVEEATRRHLNLGPNPNKGQYWPEGRVWELQLDTPTTSPLQSGGKPNAILTSFNQKQSDTAAATANASTVATASTAPSALTATAATQNK